MVKRNELIVSLRKLYRGLTDGIETDYAVRVKRYKPILQAITLLENSAMAAVIDNVQKGGFGPDESRLFGGDYQ